MTTNHDRLSAYVYSPRNWQVSLKATEDYAELLLLELQKVFEHKTLTDPTYGPRHNYRTRPVRQARHITSGGRKP